MRAGNLSYEDMILHMMKRDVLRQKSIGPFAAKKTPAAGDAPTTVSADAPLRDEDAARVSRLQECLKADQLSPFIDSNEPDIIDRRDISAVLDQHLGHRQSCGAFGRRVGHSLKLAKFGVFSATHTASASMARSHSTTTISATGPDSFRTTVASAESGAAAPVSAVRRMMMPLQRGSAMPAYKVWPVNPNTATPQAATTEGASDQQQQQASQDSVLGNAVALGQRPS